MGLFSRWVLEVMMEASGCGRIVEAIQFVQFVQVVEWGWGVFFLFCFHFDFLYHLCNFINRYSSPGSTSKALGTGKLEEKTGVHVCLRHPKCRPMASSGIASDLSISSLSITWEPARKYRFLAPPQNRDRQWGWGAWNLCFDKPSI